MQSAYNEFGQANFNDSVLFNKSIGVVQDSAWNVGNDSSQYSSGVFFNGIKPYKIVFPIVSGNDYQINLNNNSFFYFEITGETSIVNPESGLNGQYFELILKQNDVGGHSVSFGDNYLFSENFTSISTGANKSTRINAVILNAKILCQVTNF